MDWIDARKDLIRSPDLINDRITMGIRLIDPVKKKYRVQFWYHRKCYRKVVYGNMKLAREVEAKMRANLAEGTYFPERREREIRIEEAAERFLRECPTFKKSAHKVAIYVRGIVRFFKGKRLSEIKAADVYRFREALGKRMSEVGVNHYHRILRRLFNWSEEVGIFKGENPASGKKVRFTNERPYWRTRFLDSVELKRLVEVSDGRIRPIIICAILTGMRKGELRAMRRRDVNLERRVIMIPNSKTGEPGW